MVGMAQFATAKACKFNLYYYGAIIFWIGGRFCVSQRTNKSYRRQYERANRKTPPGGIHKIRMPKD